MDLAIKRKTRLIKLIISLLIIILSVLSVEFFSNFNVITLNQTEKGVLEINSPPETSNGYVDHDIFYVTNSNPSIKWNLDGKYVHKFKFDYSSPSMLEGTIRVNIINGFGKEEVKELHEGNPVVLTENVLNINERVSSIEFVFSETMGDTIAISNPRIDNTFNFNKYRMFVVFSVVLSIELLFIFRKFFANRLEYAFVVLALLIGSSMLVCLPSNKIGWDEEVHFGRSYRLAMIGETEELPNQISSFFTVSAYNWPLVQPGAVEENEAFDNINNEFYENAEKDTEVQGWTSGVYTPGYVFEAIGIKIAKIFNASFSTVVFMGRFASLISFIILVFLSIRTIPIGKEILFFLSIMPTSIFIAITYNYDVVVYGCIVLGLSMILKEWLTKDYEVNWKNLLIACICLFIGCIPKAVYAPIVLLPLLIPKERFTNQKQAKLIKLSFIILFIILVSSFVLPSLMGKATNDTRGGAVDSTQQLSLILSHPIEYTKVLLKNIFDNFPSFVFGEATFRSMGHIGTAGFAYLVPITATMLIVTSPQEENVEIMTIKNRIFIFVMIALTVALVWTSMYMAFTVPGSTIIMGVQGRYYRPFLLLFYLIISPNLKISIKKETYRYALMVVCFIILSVTLLQIMSLYCL